MAIVYVVQKQMRWDERRRGMVSRFNMEPARQYGDLTYLLPSEAEPDHPTQIIEQLHQRLAPITSKDHLLLVGNPCLIGWATAIAADITEGQLSMLQWHARERRYIAVRADIFPNG